MNGGTIARSQLLRPFPQFSGVTSSDNNGTTRIRLGSNIRYFPSRLAGLRSPMVNLWDISLVKQVHLGGRVRAQLNVEFLNAFNQVYYNNPNTDPTSSNFGKVTRQNNLPRDIQLAAKIVF